MNMNKRIFTVQQGSSSSIKVFDGEGTNKSLDVKVFVKRP